jgi:hypothetical protein
MGSLEAPCIENEISQAGVWEVNLNNVYPDRLFFNEDGSPGMVESFHTRGGFIFTSEGYLNRYNYSTPPHDSISRVGFSYSLSNNDKWIAFARQLGKSFFYS